MKEHDIIETFDFGIIYASIHAGKNGKGFKPCVGGGAISPTYDDIKIVRGLIFVEVDNQLRCRQRDAEQSIETIKKLRTRLGTDVFNMGKFKKD